MELKVDYHIHTNYSDGVMTPTQIIKKFKDEEYDVIAITDHDGIDGLNEAKIAGEAIELKVILGIELSAVTDDERSLHILGYNIDINNSELKEAMIMLKKWREDRNIELLKLLNSKGYDIDLEEIYNKKGNKYIGKPDIARVLYEKGQIKSIEEAFDDEKGVFSSAEVTDIKKRKLRSNEAINLIKRANGTPVLAHPMKIKGLGKKGSNEFFDNLDELVKELKKQGLRGIECFHPSATFEDSNKVVMIAEKYHLHITEGSDFHGE